MNTLATPATRRGELRQDALLEVAARAFLENGYARTSLDSIVAEAGGSKRSVYDLFGDKAGLFGAVMDHQRQHLLEQLNTIDLAGLTLEQGLITIGETFLGFLLSPRALASYRVLVAETPQFPELGQRFFDSGPDNVANRLAAYMQRQSLAIDDTGLAARQLLGMLKGDLHLRALLHPESLPGQEAIRAQVTHAVQLFLSGVPQKP